MSDFVLVTGASKGTGLAVCERFAREGWNVVITSRRAEDAEAAAAFIRERYPVRAMGFASSADDLEGVSSLFKTLREEHCQVGALVLNAADLGMGQNALEVSLDDWQRVINTNLCWNFALMQECARGMTQSGGAMVIIGSNTARRAIPDRSAYIASKGGLTALCKALAIEWGQYGIRVNIIISGSIKTERWASQTEEWRQIRRDRAPIGDIADFSDIANAAYFLASEEARVITGTELTVDGGVDAQFVPRDMR